MVNEKVNIPSRGDLQELTSDEDEAAAEKWNVQNYQLQNNQK